MVKRDEQGAVAIGAREEAHPQHGSAREIERPMRFLRDPARELVVVPDSVRVARWHVLEIDRDGFVHAGGGLAVHLDVGRSQDAMAIDERLKRAAQRGDVHVRADAPRPRHVVGGAVRIEPVQQPERALAVRERAGARVGLLLFEELRQETAFLVRRQARKVVGRLAHASRIGDCAAARPDRPRPSARLQTPRCDPANGCYLLGFWPDRRWTAD